MHVFNTIKGSEFRRFLFPKMQNAYSKNVQLGINQACVWYHGNESINKQDLDTE